MSSSNCQFCRAYLRSLLEKIYGCVALANPEKRIYLLGDLSPDTDHALLQLIQMCSNHPKGGFSWKNQPQQLESTILACIPSILTFSPEKEDEE
ncbi:hypothetical protein NIES2135_65750 (plasmid) [Leptolyngbya boryana NIES-2135]|uniref:Uncharacterized protein n=1 Tax=Leptolyngbya boryana NIES-2135 TaxID=1973484 RepID=A0A1Z4JSU1_LEPBY|nr:hypothetical protein NIES2135_65750 [Leptolyngbya boryana NIES-2135]